LTHSNVMCNMCKVSQRNLTLSVENELLELARRYARSKNISLNKLVRELLEQAVVPQPKPNWIEDFIETCKEVQGDSGGKKWSREDLHER
jgi:hypothetical protein